MSKLSKKERKRLRRILLAAALLALVSLLPVSIVFLCLQKYFIEGIATTGMKG